MYADLTNVEHLLIRCEAINEVVEAIAGYLERNGQSELAAKVRDNFTDAIGE